MVAIGISEFTYGFAFLHEQVNLNRGGLIAAPILPSLQVETEQGWDARIPRRGIDVYYQFKLSEYLSRGNAKYIADGTYTAPYYRLAFLAKYNNKQHRRLMEHAQNHPETYYVAPEFHDLSNFNSFFLSSQISQNSRLIPLNNCANVSPNDGTQHYITFQSGSPSWIQHSDPKKCEISYSGSDISSHFMDRRNDFSTINVESLGYSFDILQKEVRLILGKEKDFAREVRKSPYERAKELEVPIDFTLLEHPVEKTRVQYLRKTADLLSVFYGVCLVIVGEG